MLYDHGPPRIALFAVPCLLADSLYAPRHLQAGKVYDGNMGDLSHSLDKFSLGRLEEKHIEKYNLKLVTMKHYILMNHEMQEIRRIHNISYLN